MKCDNCQELAVQRVKQIGSSGRVLMVSVLCAEHVRQEHQLTNLGLSMTRTEFEDLPAETPTT